MARARPLHRALTPEALEAATRPGDLAVIVVAGETEAAVRPVAAHAGADALERDRLQRDLAEAEGRLTAARERLANDSFVSLAPASVVDGARAREAELSDQVARLRDRLER
jgi:valyl-tRNA synthetase